MKHLFIVFAVMIHTVSFAQTPDAFYTDCNGNTESIYSILAQNKPLIIASKGLDCSICMSHAPSVKTFSEQHPEIRIWGAMSYKYSGAQPTCTGVNDWKNDYAWDNIFMFPDVNKDWEGVGYPTYYVISPVDSSVQYEGSSFSQASAKALELSPTGLIEKTAEKLNVFYDAPAHAVQLHLASNEEIQTVMIANLMGQVMLETPVQPLEKIARIPLSGNFTKGIYLVSLRSVGGKLYSSRITVQ